MESRYIIVGWRYRMLIDKHVTGPPRKNEISMLDEYGQKVWGTLSSWRYEDGPIKPEGIDWMHEAQPLFALHAEVDNGYTVNV